MTTDCAWRSRVTSFYSGAEGAAIIARATNAPRVVKATEIEARPFRFEDLNGKPEPEHWGPCYPKTASAAVEKWRMTARGRELTPDEKRQYGAAVGQWIRALNSPAKRVRIPDSDLHYEFSLAKWNAAIKARFAADAARDRRQWAEGKLKGFAKGERGLTIHEVYARAMAAKRARLELEEAA